MAEGEEGEKGSDDRLLLTLQNELHLSLFSPDY